MARYTGIIVVDIGAQRLLVLPSSRQTVTLHIDRMIVGSVGLIQFLEDSVPVSKQGPDSVSPLWWPGAGKAFVWPSLGEAIIKLIVLYLLLVVIAAVLSFVFKSSPASWPSTILFWVIAVALAVWIFTH